MENSKISRRDFLKLFVHTSPLFLVPPISRLPGMIGKEAETDLALKSAREFLVIRQDIPNSVVNTPKENEMFLFADEILQNSIDIYNRCANENGYPPAFYNKPRDFLTIKNPHLYHNLINQEAYPFLDKLWSSIKSGKPIEQVEIDNLTDIKNEVIRIIDGDEAHTIKFSQMDVKDAKDLLQLDPGSPLLARVKARIGENASEDEIVNALHEEIDYIWEWVDRVGKGKPMQCDKFLAGLININKGDVAGSLWDFTVLTKLAARNNHKDFKFNDVRNVNEQSDLATIRRENAVLLTRLQDPFSIRISANWALHNVDDTDLFAHLPSKYAPKNYKPFDSYAEAGIFYHGANILALAGVMDYRFIQLILLLKYTFPKEKLGFNMDQGLEKIMSDLISSYKSNKVQDILFALPEKKITPQFQSQLKNT